MVYSEIYTEMKTLPEIAEAGNAILIAEGGMGKTFALEEFKKCHPAEIKKLDLALLSGDVQGLRSDIERAADKKYIFIDGLDEAASLCPNLLGILQRTEIPAHIVLAS